MSLHDKMTALADAIRSRTGITDPLTLDQMAQAVAAISGGTSLPTADTVTLTDPEGGAYLESNGQGIQFTASLPAGSGAMVIDENTRIIIKVPSTTLGDAKASDVRSGKTFTSGSGLCKTGTLEV